VSSSTGKRLLVVDDDVETLEMLEAWAERLGCDVRTARSGHEALEMDRMFRPHVLIADYWLEDELTGVDVIVWSRGRNSDVACVLITNALHEALRESFQRIHGVIILPKPVNLDRLQQIVAAA
jgi:DNA-binding NtrC family response regulator